jgi:hypothetical protein
LRGVTAGFAAPFARGEIGLDVVLRQALEAHACFDQALPVGLLRRHQADRGVDAMIASGQEPQALGSFVDQLGVGQDAPAHRHHGIGGEDVSALQLFVGAHQIERHLGLGAGEPIGAGARQFSAPRRLVDVGGAQRVGLDAGLIDERHPAGRARSEDELGTADHFCLRRNCVSIESTAT